VRNARVPNTCRRNSDCCEIFGPPKIKYCDCGEIFGPLKIKYCADANTILVSMRSIARGVQAVRDRASGRLCRQCAQSTPSQNRSLYCNAHLVHRRARCQPHARRAGASADHPSAVALLLRPMYRRGRSASRHCHSIPHRDCSHKREWARAMAEGARLSWPVRPASVLLLACAPAQPAESRARPRASPPFIDPRGTWVPGRVARMRLGAEPAALAVGLLLELQPPSVLAASRRPPYSHLEPGVVESFRHRFVYFI
jgi:hypothetical protein